MLRLNNVVFVVLFTALLPLTANAERVEILGGNFVFPHEPVNPEQPDGYCDNGLLYSVTSEFISGVLETETSDLVFSGVGNAEGCAFFEPIKDVAAEFAGSFTWYIDGDELNGTFELLDFPTEFEGVFYAVIFISFDGGTGRFERAKGTAIATGLDFPFGGVNGDPDLAGAVVDPNISIVDSTIEGVLRLKK